MADNRYKKFMQKGGFARYAKGGPARGKTKKYATAGEVSQTYGANVLPQGVLPSQHIAFSEGANQFTQVYQNQLDEASENVANFEPTPENLGVVDPLQNPVGTAFTENVNPNSLEKLGVIDPDEDFSNVVSSQHDFKDTKFGSWLDKTFGKKEVAEELVTSPITGTNPNLAATTYGNELPSIMGSEGAGNIGNAPIFNMDTFNASNSVVPPGPTPGMHPGVDLIDDALPGTTEGLQMIPAKPLPVSSTTELMPSITTNVAKGVNLGQTSAIGTAASLVGEGIKKVSDDKDATTLNVGETSGTLLSGGGKGAGMAATLGMLAPALAVPGIGWIGAGIGAAWAGLSALNKRRKERKEEKKMKEELEKQEAYAQHKSGAARQLGQSYSGFDYGVNLKLGGTPYKY